MKIINGVRSLATPFASSVLTIGNFDGVHVGHRELLKRVVARARQLDVPSVVMTFDPHPVKVLYPDRKMQRIFDFSDQREQFEKLGVNMLVIEPFSREFSQLPAERYLREWIYRPFLPETIVVGYDFSFGAHRGGSIDFLKERSAELGYRFEVVPPVKVGDVLASSTRIRQALQEGDVQLANRLLGRRFYLEGLIEKGAGRGRRLGIPTANLRTPAETLPQQGVYAAWAFARGSKWKALVNVGMNPTFVETSHQGLSVEAHLPDFSGRDLYGEPFRLEFVSRIRDERKFPSVDELVVQIRRDIAEGMRRLDEL